MRRMKNKIYFIILIDQDGKYYDLEKQTLDKIDDLTQKYNNFQAMKDDLDISDNIVNAIIGYQNNDKILYIPLLYKKDYKILSSAKEIEEEILNYTTQSKEFREKISIKYLNSDNSELAKCANIIYNGPDNTVIKVSEYYTKPKVTFEDIRENTKILLGILFEKKKGGNYRKYRDLYLIIKMFKEKRNRLISEVVIATIRESDLKAEQKDKENKLKQEMIVKEFMINSQVQMEMNNNISPGTCLRHFLYRMDHSLSDEQEKNNTSKIKQLKLF